MCKVLIISAVLLSLASFQTSLAQIGRSEYKIIQPNEVFISNSSLEHTLNFRISGNTCSPPLDANLKPDHYSNFKCPGAESFSFSITTQMSDGQIIERAATLFPTRRYELYADSIGVWSIREIPSR